MASNCCCLAIARAIGGLRITLCLVLSARAQLDGEVGKLQVALKLTPANKIGASVDEQGAHVHDFHTTILYQLGRDHSRLTYLHAGRNFRLTNVHGKVVRGVRA